MKRTSFMLLSLLVVMVLAAGCGAVDDVQDKVDTVDRGISLLQDIDQNGTWSAVQDGLDALEAVDGGVRMQFEFNELDQAGAAALRMEQDDDGDFRAEIVRDGQRVTVLGLAGEGDQDAALYRLGDDRYICLDDTNDTSRLLADGPASVFDRFAEQAAGVQLLSVIEADENESAETYLEREATRYRIVPVVAEARAILESVSSDALQTPVAQAGEFSATGELLLDDATGALLALTSVYTPAESGPAFDFRFAVTQWGGVADITPLEPVQIAVPCGA